MTALFTFFHTSRFTLFHYIVAFLQDYLGMDLMCRPGVCATFSLLPAALRVSQESTAGNNF